MKLNDLRTLIREEIQNELAEAKKKKKDEAKKKIMEIIAEAELTEEDLKEDNFFKNTFDKVKQTVKDTFGPDKFENEVNDEFKTNKEKIDAYLNFWNRNVKKEEKEAAEKDLEMMKTITSSLAALAKLIGIKNISTTHAAEEATVNGKKVKLDTAFLGNNGVESIGKVWQVKTKAGDSANFVTGTGE